MKFSQQGLAFAAHDGTDLADNMTVEDLISVWPNPEAEWPSGQLGGSRWAGPL